jgi:sugar phosphate isomerase/epimerase
VGEGNLDMKAIIEAGLAMGSKYLIIEQDDTYGKDPFESLAISADNLKRMGYQDLF